ncbi:MAG: glycine betaine ABC transporter substrate-binding protein [Solirubrobacteraceae bacterium]
MNAVLAAGLLAISLALGGCASSDTGSAATTATMAAATATATAATATATATTATAATTAAAPVTTTVATTTPAQVLPGTGKPVVAIGDKNYTEQFILGELYQLALSTEGFSTTLSQNIGTTSVSLQAMQDGTLDVYPEYLNVFDSEIAGYSNPFSTLSGAYTAGQSWAVGNGLMLLAPTPFDDTAGIAVASGYASQKGLRSLYGLRRVATTLTLGAPPEFQSSPSGLPAIEQAYGFVPATVQSLNIGGQYQALSAGAVQAAYVNTTDGQLSSPAYMLLGDPRHAFGFGNVVPVVTNAVISAEGPAFANTINQVDALLTTTVMRQLNAEVDLEHETPEYVARAFLQGDGLLTASGS